MKQFFNSVEVIGRLIHLDILKSDKELCGVEIKGVEVLVNESVKFFGVGQ